MNHKHISTPGRTYRTERRLHRNIAAGERLERTASSFGKCVQISRYREKFICKGSLAPRSVHAYQDEPLSLSIGHCRLGIVVAAPEFDRTTKFPVCKVDRMSMFLWVQCERTGLTLSAQLH